MDAIGYKLARQFKLTDGEVDALRAAGFDTPHKIKAAKSEELPHGLADKLAARLRGAVEFAAPAAHAPRAKKHKAEA